MFGVFSSWVTTKRLKAADRMQYVVVASEGRKASPVPPCHCWASRFPGLSKIWKNGRDEGDEIACTLYKCSRRADYYYSCCVLANRLLCCGWARGGMRGCLWVPPPGCKIGVGVVAVAILLSCRRCQCWCRFFVTTADAAVLSLWWIVCVFSVKGGVLVFLCLHLVCEHQLVCASTPGCEVVKSEGGKDLWWCPR